MRGRGSGFLNRWVEGLFLGGIGVRDSFWRMKGSYSLVIVILLFLFFCWVGFCLSCREFWWFFSRRFEI